MDNVVWKSSGARRLLATACGAVLIAPAVSAAQCAMCGTAIQGENDPLARGLFWSVVFLRSLPYTIVGGLILPFVILHRRARRRSTPERRRRLGLRLIPGGARTFDVTQKEKSS